MSVHENCRRQGSFLVLYVDDILLLGSAIGLLPTVKVWLAKTFDIKDLEEASYILEIKLH